MTRLDLAFLLCCCKACLGSNESSSDEDFYSLLGIDRDATKDDIKRAYKRQSLQMHPDKLAQKGLTVTAEHQARFTRMKEAYEVLSDTHKRETYDAIGERGMKWIEEPFSVDPKEMAHNFATSSVVDRSKIFGIFVAIAIAVLIVPVLICLQADQKFGKAPWTLVLIPLWIWNIGVFIYHVRVLMMGEIEKPDHIPDEEWIDPLPMSKRIRNFTSFLLFAVFEVLFSLRIDNFIGLNWSYAFIPLLCLELSNLLASVPRALVQIITVQELEIILGKKIEELSPDEKSWIEGKYIIVSSRTSEEFMLAFQKKSFAKQDVIKICCKIFFITFMMVQLGTPVLWNWWFVFSPLIVMAFWICHMHCQNLMEVQRNVASKLVDNFDEAKGDYGAMEEGELNNENPGTRLSDEEKEKLEFQVQAATSKVCGSCCTGAFSLVLLVLVQQKINGAGFSCLWIISPFLFLASVILCILSCAIFGVSPIDEDGFDFEGSGLQNSMRYTPPTDTAPSSQNIESTQESLSEPFVHVEKPVEKDIEQPVEKVSEKPTEKAEVWQDSPPVDLLDENEDSKQVSGPTPSEVDDLD